MILFIICPLLFQRTTTNNAHRHAKMIIDAKKNYFSHYQTSLSLGQPLTSATFAKKTQIVETSHLIGHDGRTVAQFSAKIFLISSLDRNLGTVLDLAQGDDSERHWQ
ncbi:hypothetical protein Tsp_09676 [Trichinella spiralis]|uniref:hypothetical protein n=1 Tax=Trichinella spiralis TaxID=6334 RepID=UPI0001EFD327|nr:hypothetical protein Tsp_09676 [Trichinella spiralis]